MLKKYHIFDILIHNKFIEKIVYIFYNRSIRKEMLIMKKILIIGSPGSGKSTFARKLRDITKLPLYYMDMMYHKKIEQQYLIKNCI
jgi:ATP-dependent protease HslVU (ClpYQ) ATPase subunit